MESLGHEHSGDQCDILSPIEYCFGICELEASTCLRMKSVLKGASFAVDEELDGLEKGPEDSGKFDDGTVFCVLDCSFTDTAIDLKESIPNGDGAPIFCGELFKVSLFRYKGANMGGGTGNKD